MEDRAGEIHRGEVCAGEIRFGEHGSDELRVVELHVGEVRTAGFLTRPIVPVAATASMAALRAVACDRLRRRVPSDHSQGAGSRGEDGNKEGSGQARCRSASLGDQTARPRRGVGFGERRRM